MTNTQKTQLSMLQAKYNTVGLDKGEMARKTRLEATNTQETSRLASQLQGWSKRHDTQPIPAMFEPVKTIYINDVI